MPYNPVPQLEKPTYEPPTQNQQQPIIAQQYAPNQQNPYIVVQQQYTSIPQVKFKTKPVIIVCPYCKNNITSIVETHFNLLNCCFFSFFPCIWCLVAVCNDKEFCCCDATHKCPTCGNLLGKYHSC